MRTQWDEKVAKALKKKNQDAEYAAMSEDKGRHSWVGGTSGVHGDKPLSGSEIQRREREMKWIMLWSFRYAMGIILLAIGFHCAYKSKNEHKIADTIFWCTWMIIIARGFY